MNPKESYDAAFDQGRRAALPNSPFRLAKKTRQDCPYIQGRQAVQIDGVYISTKPVWWKGWTAGWDSVDGIPAMIARAKKEQSASSETTDG